MPTCHASTSETSGKWMRSLFTTPRNSMKLGKGAPLGAGPSEVLGKRPRPRSDLYSDWTAATEPQYFDGAGYKTMLYPRLSLCPESLVANKLLQGSSLLVQTPFLVSSTLCPSISAITAMSSANMTEEELEKETVRAIERISENQEIIERYEGKPAKKVLRKVSHSLRLRGCCEKCVDEGFYPTD